MSIPTDVLLMQNPELFAEKLRASLKMSVSVRRYKFDKTYRWAVDQQSAHWLDHFRKHAHVPILANGKPKSLVKCTIWMDVFAELLGDDCPQLMKDQIAELKRISKRTFPFDTITDP